MKETVRRAARALAILVVLPLASCATYWPVRSIRRPVRAQWRRLLPGVLLFLLPLRVTLGHAGAALSGGLALPLPAAIAMALRVSPQVRQAEDLRTAGRYGARAGRASLLPRLSLVAGRYWNETRDGQPQFVSANGAHETIGLLQLSLPLYSPQLRALTRSERSQVRLEVAAQAADAWYQLALLHARVRIWKSTLRSVPGERSAT